MLIIIQRQIKSDNQKLILRIIIRFDEPFPVFSGLQIKMVSFSLKLLPALERTRKEKRSVIRGNIKNPKIIISCYSISYA